MNSISDSLAELVSPDFYVDIQQHVTILNPEDEAIRHVIPDVYVAEQPPVAPPPSRTGAVITQPTLVEPLEQLEIHERFLEIRDRRSREVITILEVLSTWNKAAGKDRWDTFQTKRRQVMASHTHWIEIDLLRAGRRPAEVAGKSDYYALLKRGGTIGPYEVWHFDLRDRLPTIAVPLRASYEDVPLDLSAVLTDVYRRARYAESIDYMSDIPSPRLRPADRQWASKRIRNWADKRLSQ
ncbi:MAG: hypothetical protein ETSY1_18645 [Candidatus Entotheonella factor]|uniref:Uncharacterized protein n=2 Tax=Candidatus Entotheonella TaxID=93171 RepID=W4LL76_ENTF1|nr:MAG: hypothetical protein ETSY1_18645 [Candidatus Entotheonella factor]